MNVYRIILQVPKRYVTGSTECSYRDLYAVAESFDEALSLYREKWKNTPIASIEQVNGDFGTDTKLLYRQQRDPGYNLKG